MRVAVLGAGVIGVAAAYYLRRAGMDVVVVDRQTETASETSFANGGQISVCHAEPWANPRTPFKALKWMLDDDAPLRIRLGTDPAQWRWLLAFLRECRVDRTNANIRQLVNLGLHSRACLSVLRAEAGLQYDQRTQGILHIYTSHSEFEAARTPAHLMTELGCERRMLNAAEAIAIEPALKTMHMPLVGATYAPDDESGDAQQFTESLAQRCVSAGVEFALGQTIERLTMNNGRVTQVELLGHGGERSTLKADAFVLALGSFSPLLARPLGIRLQLIPAKGYSLTLPVAEPARAYSVPLIDDEHKLVFSRLGNRLRVAGMAELRGYDQQIDPQRGALLLRRLEQLFPGAGDAGQARYWTGLRPSTPSNVPYVGCSSVPNLYLNTGHGTLGWTHACGSGQALADIICGRKPEVDFAFCGLS
ncbi:MAG: D-amino acid dehydrogenase [Pseudomonadota bacterium]|nr:D-amino acid dehydrogenase [Pseudomonadota bacterium]